MKLKLLFALFLSFFALTGHSQIIEPIKWNATLRNTQDKTIKELVFTAQLDGGWHLYAMDIPEGGPISTLFNFDTLEGAVLEGSITPMQKAYEEFSKLFDMKLRWYSGSPSFVQQIKIQNPEKYKISGYVRYQACNDATCLPPTKFPFEVGLNISDDNVAKEEDSNAIIPVIPLKKSGDSNDLWEPVIQELKELGDIQLGTESSSLWFIFISGFLGGLLALLTPCVWPMIPLTVSFFLKKGQNRRKSIADAVIYGVSIIVIYLALGMIITLLFGANALNSLSTNAIFNILFFGLLLLFAISFFGAFELTLPSSWTNKFDRKAETATGLFSMFFMAFTLALVSFSCTGPIIGTLLVQAATIGAKAGPAIGMFGFAFALSIPFTLFAIFPSWMKQMPKSGGWLNSVKVVLGFLELALSLKFLSVADLAYGWHILDRETFLALWIVIFILLGLYLLGKIRFPHDSETKNVSVPRFFMALISLSFAIYMIPGLWGAPLKSISAFTPPLYTQDFNLYEGEVHASFNNYDEGMAYASKMKKPVLVDFSGYGCVNCRKMEASVWTAPQVKQLLDNDFVLITLMVDDRSRLAKPETVTENGKKLILETLGEKWSYLQRSKFGANAQPYYIILNNKGKPLVTPYTYDESVSKFVKFLEQGLEKYKQEK